MKRILALILSVCILIMCCGCDLFGGNSSYVNSKKKPSSNNSSGDDSVDDYVDDDYGNSTTRIVTKSSIELDGTATESPLISDDEEEAEDSNQAVSADSVKTFTTKWDSQTVSHPKGNTDALAKTMREKIVNAKNTTYKAKGTTYYISPNGDDNNSGKSKNKPIKTTTALAGIDLKKGDVVLFERGGVWRLSRAIECKEGVTYAAYGDESKDKPAIYGSKQNYVGKNYAGEYYWKPTNLKNVWRLTVRDSSIGLVVFNNGELVGACTTKGLLALSKNGDFYYNSAKGILYLYCNKGNPGKAYKDIEVCLNKVAFDVSVPGVTIDNFKIKYFGRLGVDLAAADNTVVKNCEVGFIGGAFQNPTTRLGNAIQMWQGCDGHLVENCWIYQIYDTGLTFQGDALNPMVRCKRGTHDEDYLNMTYRNNLIEYCCLSFEFWHGNHNTGDTRGGWRYTDAVFKNIHVEGNLSRFAGYGWSSMAGQRPDAHGEHLVMYAHTYPYVRDFYIENNIFDLASQWICRWDFSKEYSEDTNVYTRKKIGGTLVEYAKGQFRVEGGTSQPIDKTYYNGIWYIRKNTYYHCKNRNNYINWYGSQTIGSGQAKLEEIIGKFDTSPTKVVWVS